VKGKTHWQWTFGCATAVYHVIAPTRGKCVPTDFLAGVRPQCPGPIGSEGDKFRAHGLYLRPGQNAVHTLYVVHHGGRESIRFSNSTPATKAPTLTWIGCALRPDPIGLNSVVGLSDGGLSHKTFCRGH